ncbi:MAG TPA: isochorismatase family cysteine hydrolase [Synergistales bacterium]|nr:isochorismatase family cysteine hydrolase [Synergistales bacterium]
MRVNDRYVSLYYEDDHEIGKVVIEREKTALLIVDLQRVFLTRPTEANLPEERKASAKKWKPFYDKIDKVVIPNNRKILKAFREKKMEVIFAKIQGYKKDGRDRSLVHKATGFNELLLPPGSRDAEIVPELAPIEDEIVITKTTDSAINGTKLALILKNMGIDTVVVTGVFTDQCVSGTVRGLADESFKVWLIEDGCMAATEEIQSHELAVLNNIYCHVINTKELLEAII